MKRRLGTWILGILFLLPAFWSGVVAQDFERQTLSLLVPNAWDVAVADLDNDGDLDVVATGSQAGGVCWVQNSPTGMSTFPIGYVMGQGPRGVETGDLDGDGDADVVVAGYGENRFVLFENLGSGTSARFREHTLRDSCYGAWSADAGDADGDGDLDLVLTEYLGHAVRILTRSDTVWSETVFSVMYPLCAVFADFDSDGDSDVVGGASYGPLFWIEQTSGGWVQHSLGFGDVPTSVVAADLDGDGDRDLAASLFAADRVVCWMRTASGFVGDTLPWIINAPRDLLVADFDQDHRLDLVVASQFGSIVWFRRTESGYVQRSMPGGSSIYGMALADFDRDGDPDVIVADRDASEIALYRNLMGVPAVVQGTVTSEREGSPVSGVNVRLHETGSVGVTDAAGRFRIVAGEGVYTLVASHPCWNGTTIAGVQLIRADTTVADFTLTRPLLGLSLSSLNLSTFNGVPMQAELPVSNPGDGLLEISAEVSGNYENDLWLSIAPSSAAIPPGGNLAFTVAVAPDTLNDANWDYYGDIILRTNACPDSVRHVAVILYVLDAPFRPHGVARRTELYPSYPNPFNGRTTVRFALAAAADVDLRVFDVTGREAMRVLRGRWNAGEQTVNVNAGGLASGVYVLVLRAGEKTLSQKLLLIR